MKHPAECGCACCAADLWERLLERARPAEAPAEAPPSQPAKARANGHRITWDASAKQFAGITEADRLRWQEAYPHISVPDQIAALAAWLAVPGRRKSNHEGFIVRNLARANDKKDRP